MFHPVSIYIGLRYLRGRSGDRFSRFVSYMSTAGITIGVLALVTVLSVMNGFEGQLKGRILGVLPHAVITNANEKVDAGNKPEFMDGLSHVVAATPITRSEAVIQSAYQLSAGMLIGVNPQIGDPISQHVISGSLADLETGKYRVMLGYSLARQLNIKVGDKIRLMVTGSSQFTPLGRVPRQRNFTVSGLFNTGSDIDTQLIVGNITDVGKLLRLSAGHVSGWRLFLDDPFVVSELANQALPQDWVWSDWRAQRGELFQAVKMEKNMMGLMLGLIVAVAAFNIISALIMVVMEKQSEVAILKTQGMTQSQVMAIFVVQGASSGVIGAIAGGLAGVLLASNLNELLVLLGVQLFSAGTELPVVINTTQILSVTALAILLSVAATLLPSYRAASVKPAEALRYE